MIQRSESQEPSNLSLLLNPLCAIQGEIVTLIFQQCFVCYTAALCPVPPPPPLPSLGVGLPRAGSEGQWIGVLRGLKPATLQDVCAVMTASQKAWERGAS